jgi:hypothetical protein
MDFYDHGGTITPEIISIDKEKLKDILKLCKEASGRLKKETDTFGMLYKTINVLLEIQIKVNEMLREARDDDTML